MQPTTKIIGLKALRNEMGYVAESVLLGNQYIVIKHSMPIFRIVPVEENKPKPDAFEAALKLAGFLKQKKGPDALKWQKKNKTRVGNNKII